MQLTRNIIGMLVTAALILSGVLFGMPGDANAKLHAGMVHAEAKAEMHGAGHHGSGKQDHAHNHGGESETEHSEMKAHADHVLCNAMACCPVVSLGVCEPTRTQLALRISHWPDPGKPLVGAAPERADKPPKHI